MNVGDLHSKKYTWRILDDDKAGYRVERWSKGSPTSQVKVFGPFTSLDVAVAERSKYASEDDE